MTAGVDVGMQAPSRVTCGIAIAQLAIGALLAVAYAVLVGPTLVDVWSDDDPDGAFAQFFFSATAVVAVVVTGYALLTGWLVWRSARGGGTDPGAAMIMLILQAVAWGAAALLTGLGFFGSFSARPVAVIVASGITVFSLVSAGWLVSRDRD